jgi:hypothetical protein
VHDRLLQQRPAEHQLDGNVSASGASCAVLRKVKNDVASASVKASAGIVDPFTAASALAADMEAEDQRAMKDHPERSKVRCFGFLHCLYKGLKGQYVIGGYMDW